MRNPWAFVAGFVGIVTLDQVSKALVVSNLSAGPMAGIPSEGAIQLVGGDFLRIALVYNTGTLFRFLLPFLSPALGYGILFALAALLLARHALARPLAIIRWGIVLAMGGATGNLVDQIGFGRVVDFLSLGIPGLAWRSPTFNFADVAICTGAALLAWGEFRHSHPTSSLHGVPDPGSHGARNV